MKTVYTVCATDHCETNAVIRAFELEQDAKDFAAKCNEYQSTRQKCLELGDLRTWCIAHPAGDESDDFYYVKPIPFGV